MRARHALLPAGLAALALALGACGEQKVADIPSQAPDTTTTAAKPQGGPLDDLSRKPAVTPPSGPAPSRLVVRDVVRGKGRVARPGDRVTVQYVGVLYRTGEQFDASWDNGSPFSFTLGRGQVIPGWDQGVKGMRVGGRRELVIPARLAYGAQGSPPAIGPDEPLVFVVDLLRVR
jgi:peptidylprolyl isomerase